MERFGTDKPDMRYGMELFNLSDIVKNCGFGVFSGPVAEGGSVRGINAKNALSILTRKEIDKLTEFVKGIGAKGLAWIRLNEDGSCTSSFAKFMTQEEMDGIINAAGAGPGDVVLIVGDSDDSLVLSVLGALRATVARRIDIVPKDSFSFLWVVEFPFFEWDRDENKFVAMHHPFTSPMDDCLEYLETDKAKVRAKAYDLVLNGIELSSGSIRITDPELQKRIFTLLGLSEEEARAKFGYLIEAFRYGAPPHGGMGIGLDRLIMQMLGCESLRDVVAYPKVQNASEPMTECPGAVDEAQLTDLGLRLV
jgi:aspartyl-tRNA synthetase